MSDWREAAPVLYAAKGLTRAHVMRWDHRAGTFQSQCGWSVRRRYADLQEATETPPAVPWCSSCRAIAQRTVNGLLAAGVVTRTLPGLERSDRAS